MRIQSQVPTFLPECSSVQSLNHVWLLATPWTAARQASLSITNSRSLLKLTSIESVIPSNHLILCHPLLLLPLIFPSIRVFSNESALRIRWPKYQSFSFSISPSNKYSGLFRWIFQWIFRTMNIQWIFFLKVAVFQWLKTDDKLNTYQELSDIYEGVILWLEKVPSVIIFCFLVWVIHL